MYSCNGASKQMAKWTVYEEWVMNGGKDIREDHSAGCVS